MGSNVEDKTLESFGEYKIKLAGGELLYESPNHGEVNLHKKTNDGQPMLYLDFLNVLEEIEKAFLPPKIACVLFILVTKIIDRYGVGNRLEDEAVKIVRISTQEIQIM